MVQVKRSHEYEYRVLSVVRDYVGLHAVDRIAWFHAAAIMGADGWPAVQGFGIEKLAMMPRFARYRATALGSDMLTELKRPT